MGARWFASMGRGVRAIQTMAKLGGAVISSVSDLAALAVNRQYQGRSMLDSWGDAFGAAFEGRKGSELREMADLMGVGLDGHSGRFYVQV